MKFQPLWILEGYIEMGEWPITAGLQIGPWLPEHRWLCICNGYLYLTSTAGYYHLQPTG